MNSNAPVFRLEDLPNIGRNIANDLRALGIQSPADLRQMEPLVVFHELRTVMGHRHDPCGFYILLSVRHFFMTSEKLPWWRLTEKGRALLRI